MGGGGGEVWDEFESCGEVTAEESIADEVAEGIGVAVDLLEADEGDDCVDGLGGLGVFVDVGVSGGAGGEGEEEGDKEERFGE